VYSTPSVCSIGAWVMFVAGERHRAGVAGVGGGLQQPLRGVSGVEVGVGYAEEPAAAAFRVAAGEGAHGDRRDDRDQATASTAISPTTSRRRRITARRGSSGARRSGRSSGHGAECRGRRVGS
jgi:hypothetical protein